jgi:hypothetical protein
MEIKWIEHKGRKILYDDFRGAKNENELMELLYQAIEIEKKSAEKFLLLINVENTYMTQKYMDEVKRSGKEYRNEKALKTALVGITGLKKILYQGYIAFTGNTKTKPFDNEEAAKDWLVQ